MRSILVSKVGTPIIDAQGNFTEITGIESMKQQVVNIFATQKGHEVLFPAYGFDYITLNAMVPTMREYTLKSLVAEAISPSNNYSIKQVNGLETFITGQTAAISVDIIRNDETYISKTLLLSLEEGQNVI